MAGRIKFSWTIIYSPTVGSRFLRYGTQLSYTTTNRAPLPEMGYGEVARSQ